MTCLGKRCPLRSGRIGISRFSLQVGERQRWSTPARPALPTPAHDYVRVPERGPVALMGGGGMLGEPTTSLLTPPKPAHRSTSPFAGPEATADASSTRTAMVAGRFA